MSQKLFLLLSLAGVSYAQWGLLPTRQEQPQFMRQFQGGQTFDSFPQANQFGMGGERTFPQQPSFNNFQNTFPFSAMQGQMPSINPQTFSNPQVHNPSMSSIGVPPPQIAAMSDPTFVVNQQIPLSSQFNMDGMQLRDVQSNFAQSSGNSVTLASGKGKPPLSLFGPNGPQIPGVPGGHFGAESAQTQSQSQPQRVIPPFLQGVDKETEDKFYAIVQNPSMSGQHKGEKIEEFVRDLDTQKQNIFSAYQRQVESQVKEKQQKVHQAVDNMTDEAKQQFQKVSALMTQQGLSDSDRLQRIEELYKKLPESVRKEFDAKLAAFAS